MNLKHSKLVAFGSTRRKNTKAEDDPNLQSLVHAGTSYVAIFGKSWDFHVTDIIRTTLEENLAMIEDSIRFITESGSEVFFDASSTQQLSEQGWPPFPGAPQEDHHLGVV